jgi:hypothetical protein
METTTTDRTARLARRAQQANARTKATKPAALPPYQPKPPEVSLEPIYRDQRYFTHGSSRTQHNKTLKSGLVDRSSPFADPGYSEASVEVYRNGKSDTVELRLEVNTNWNTSETRVQCTADELRDIAYRLLDAAHDLDVNPARTLMLEDA